ncbi:hypothetical protein vB_Efae230P-4.18 [Enterococcus phage vB_Efae230P-4]|uniref:Uncharacterized protein n=1 Tax=Enterococcus phage vB_Efae230P-4 TaxID=1161939 RepID=A0A067XGX6_9CAUD|nr:hypothetical protein vB_Efae230P-4.18 [Enterococcus phage vB_Efae230P-4]AFF27950.1 hypothetical protein vB_Efae230P-4.18 [Enterococcus phage vB_Efae230P-4]
MNSKSRDSMTREEFKNRLKYLKNLYKKGIIEYIEFKGFVVVFVDSFYYEQIDLED